MTKANANSVVCECCDLDFPDWLAADDLDSDARIGDDVGGGWRCRSCHAHRGDAFAAARDHEADLRLRYERAVDHLDAESYRADDYREKMLAAFRSRDNVLKQFERLARYHRGTEDGCICGKRNCETLVVVDTSWINDRIAAMYRHG